MSPVEAGSPHPSTTMSDSESEHAPSADEADPGHTVTIASQVTHHTVVPPKQGSKAKPKDKKDVKTKELSHTFSPSMKNYLTLLRAVLAKHGEEKYNIMEKKRYIFKVLCPPAKSYNTIFFLTLNIYHTDFFGFRKGDTIDVENFQEFEELAQNIIKRKPQKITIYVDMADIQTLWRNVSK